MLGFSVSHRFRGLVVAALLAIAAFARTARAGDDANANPPLPVDRGMMQRLSNFTLKDVSNGRSLMLYGFQGRKAIVLVFLGNDCPVGKPLRAAADRDQSRILQEGRGVSGHQLQRP